MQFILSFEVIVLGVTLLINLLLGFVVYKNNPKSKTNLLFALLSVVTSEWLVVNYLALNPGFATYSLWFSRLSIFLAVPQVALFFLLATTLPHDKIQMQKNRFIGLLILASSIMALTLSPYAFTGVAVQNNSLQPVPGPGMGPFALFTVILSAAAVIILEKRVRRTTGIEKEQLRFVLAGIITMLSLIITTILLPIVLWKNTFFVPFAPLYDLIFLGATTYAIIKHRLLDIRLVVTKTVSFSLLIALFAIFYAVLFANLSFIFNATSSQFTSITISTLLALIMVFSFQPVRRLLEKITDKVFYRDHYNTNTLLHSLARIMAGTNNLTDLSHHLLNELILRMRLTRGAIIIINDNKITHTIHEGYKDMPQFAIDKVLKLHYAGKTLIFEDLPDGEQKNYLRDMEFSFVANLKNADKTIGMLCLGFKLSGDTFTADDIRVLETFSSEAAVAIQNALAFEEIQKFNVTLQDEVDKATKDFKRVNEEVYKKNIELNRITQELEEANNKLRVLDNLKDEFVSLASHELRTPMTAIKSYLWLFMQYNVTQLNPKEQLYISRAYEATDRLIGLVNDMLNVSRIESGRMTLIPKSVDMIQLTKEVFDELAPTSLRQKVALVLEPASENLPNVSADSNKIREVLINLIGNSLKFTDSGGKITVKLHTEKDMFVVDVTDTGKGIKQEDMEKLFQKFGVINENYLQKANSQGTGLGLYISKSIVNLHGGQIWVKSEGENKGTTFSFSLKIDQANR